MAKSTIFDDTNKYLFSSKRIFLQLIKAFVKEDFVAELAIDNIELIDRTFVSDEFLSRESVKSRKR